MPEIWRVGRTVGRTVYHQAFEEPSKVDALIGVMDTPALAELVVKAVNAWHAAEDAYIGTVDEGPALICRRCRDEITLIEGGDPLIRLLIEASRHTCNPKETPDV